MSNLPFLHLDNAPSSTSSKAVAEFATSLVTLKICAKFLGFVEALPYQCSSESLSGSIFQTQIKMRKKVGRKK